MLVLSRKEGEQLMIGDNVVLTITRISGNRVAIGIEAPRDVRIVRGELDRKDVGRGGVAPNAAAMHEHNVAVASQPMN
jgi:carbon storage regulator